MTLLWHAQLPQDDSLIFNFVALIYLYVLLISLQHCMQYHIVVGGSCYNSPAGFYLISGVLPLAKHLKSGKKHDHHWQISLFFLANNTLRRRQNARHFAEDTFNRIFINENIRISIKFSLKFVPKGPISNIQALVQIMPGAIQGTSHYLNQWWLVYWRIYASLGLNELMQFQVVLVMAAQAWTVSGWIMYHVCCWILAVSVVRVSALLFTGT